LNPRDMSFIGPCSERAPWENGVAWCHVLRGTNMPKVPTAHGERSILRPSGNEAARCHVIGGPNTPNGPINHDKQANLRPRQLVCLDQLGSQDSCGARPFVHREAQQMLETGHQGINGTDSSRYQGGK
jgi:hypothetical protein